MPRCERLANSGILLIVSTLVTWNVPGKCRVIAICHRLLVGVLIGSLAGSLIPSLVDGFHDGLHAALLTVYLVGCHVGSFAFLPLVDVFANDPIAGSPDRSFFLCRLQLRFACHIAWRMAQCIAPSFVDGFPYALHTVLLHGSPMVSSIIPLVGSFYNSIHTLLLVGVLVGLLDGLLVGELIGVVVGLHVRLHVGVDSILQGSR